MGCSVNEFFIKFAYSLTLTIATGSRMPPLTICKAGPVPPMVIVVLVDATLSGLEVDPVLELATSMVLV